MVIRVEDAGGEQVNIEVQVFDRSDYAKRSVFYWSMMHCGQLERGGAYSRVMRTICINILAFDLLKNEGNFRNSYSIRNDDSGNKLCHDLTIIYLETKKYLMAPGVPTNKLERWMAYLAGKEGEEMNEIARREPMIGEALNMEKLFLMNRLERLAYIQRWKQIMDEANHDERVREDAMKKGLEKGLAQGLEKGERLKAIETAHKMLARNMEISVIADLTDLSEKEVRALLD